VGIKHSTAKSVSVSRRRVRSDIASIRAAWGNDEG
jgi:hypothetical protein